MIPFSDFRELCICGYISKRLPPEVSDGGMPPESKAHHQNYGDHVREVLRGINPKARVCLSDYRTIDYSLASPGSIIQMKDGGKLCLILACDGATYTVYESHNCVKTRAWTMNGGAEQWAHVIPLKKVWEDAVR